MQFNCWNNSYMFTPSVEKFGKKLSYALYFNTIGAYLIEVEIQLDWKILNTCKRASRATCFIMSESSSNLPSSRHNVLLVVEKQY